MLFFGSFALVDGAIGWILIIIGRKRNLTIVNVSFENLLESLLGSQCKTDTTSFLYDELCVALNDILVVSVLHYAIGQSGVKMNCGRMLDRVVDIGLDAIVFSGSLAIVLFSEKLVRVPCLGINNLFFQKLYVVAFLDAGRSVLLVFCCGNITTHWVEEYKRAFQMFGANILSHEILCWWEKSVIFSLGVTVLDSIGLFGYLMLDSTGRLQSQCMYYSCNDNIVSLSIERCMTVLGNMQRKTGVKLPLGKNNLGKCNGIVFRYVWVLCLCMSWNILDEIEMVYGV